MQSTQEKQNGERGALARCTYREVLEALEAEGFGGGLVFLPGSCGTTFADINASFTLLCVPYGDDADDGDDGVVSLPDLELPHCSRSLRRAACGVQRGLRLWCNGGFMLLCMGAVPVWSTGKRA